jgi:hypothetical protein
MNFLAHITQVETPTLTAMFLLGLAVGVVGTLIASRLWVR